MFDGVVNDLANDENDLPTDPSGYGSFGPVDGHIEPDGKSGALGFTLDVGAEVLNEIIQGIAFWVCGPNETLSVLG